MDITRGCAAASPSTRSLGPWPNDSLCKRLGIKQCDLTPEQRRQDQKERTARHRTRKAMGCSAEDLGMWRMCKYATEEEFKAKEVRRSCLNSKKKIEARDDAIRKSPEHVALKNLVHQIRADLRVLQEPVSKSIVNDA